MAITTFAAIDIGSYEVSMKVFELSKRYGVKGIDTIRYRLELGTDVYSTGTIGSEMILELCRIIEKFTVVMQEYGVKEYRACATSAFRELKNAVIVVEQIYQRTGIRVEILSNPEQRFIGYKSIAAMEKDFKQIIQKGTAIVDVGGGSIQLSLFDKDRLVTTQNIKLGSLRIRERLAELEKTTTHYESLVQEFINNDIVSFKRMHMKDREIKHVIFMGDFFTDVIFHGMDDRTTFTKSEFMETYERIIHSVPEDLSMEMGVPLEYASLLIPTAAIYKCFIDIFDAEAMWAPGTVLADGIAYDFGEKYSIIKSVHDFENDIVAAAKTIGKRYSSNRAHVQCVSQIALKIFDSMKKVTHMTARDRLLLQISVILHDCGKYISLDKTTDNSFNIIRSTEIIGLSLTERNIIACVARYNNCPFGYFNQISQETGLDRAGYLRVAKLTSMLRIANALDRSHLQKVISIKAVVKEEQLILTIESDRDFTLEEGLFEEKAEFFREVFNIQPVLKRKRR